MHKGNGAIAFVRSDDLIYGYAGMKEVEQAFAAKQNARKSNLDTLKAGFERDYKTAMEGASAMGAEERQQQQSSLEAKQGQLMAYAQAEAATSAQEESEMVSSVLEQINSFVRTYAEQHGYTMVYGTTANGNILYGDLGLDITDDLLEALNAEYYGN